MVEPSISRGPPRFAVFYAFLRGFPRIVAIVVGTALAEEWPPETNREWGAQIRVSDEVVEEVSKK